MVPCRCHVLNHLSGAIAADYARTHLDDLGTSGTARTWECPDTGVRWSGEGLNGAGDTVDRLRRQER